MPNIPTEFKMEDWIPQEPNQGPPLPEFLGIYWPWYKLPGAEFEVSNLVISPTEVQVGNPVDISCTITNIGTESGSTTINLGGDFVATKSVTLGPGESQVVSFDVTPAVAKTYHVSVDGLSGSFVATTEAVADIRLENLTITPAEVMVGEDVSVSVTATNYGNKAGSKVITCNVT